MKEHITLEVAHRLFDEARDFYSGRKLYLSNESEITDCSGRVSSAEHECVVARL
jgi:hypothetical protein